MIYNDTDLFENLQIMKEVKKEDDLYFQGAFWIIGTSMSEIRNGNYKLCCHKILSDFNGSMIDKIESKRSLSHKRLWEEKYKHLLKSDKPFNYYPRGRVGINNGCAYINIIDDCDVSQILNDIIHEYCIDKLEIKKELLTALSDGGHRAHILE